MTVLGLFAKPSSFAPRPDRRDQPARDEIGRDGKKWGHQDAPRQQQGIRSGSFHLKIHAFLIQPLSPIPTPLLPLRAPLRMRRRKQANELIKRRFFTGKYKQAGPLCQ